MTTNPMQTIDLLMRDVGVDGHVETCSLDDERIKKLPWLKWSSQTLKNHTADFFRKERSRLRWITEQSQDAGPERSFYQKINRMMPADFDWANWAATANRNEQAKDGIAAGARDKVDS